MISHVCLSTYNQISFLLKSDCFMQRGLNLLCWVTIFPLIVFSLSSPIDAILFSIPSFLGLLIITFLLVNIAVMTLWRSASLWPNQSFGLSLSLYFRLNLILVLTYRCPSVLNQELLVESSVESHLGHEGVEDVNKYHTQENRIVTGIAMVQRHESPDVVFWPIKFLYALRNVNP